MIQRGLLLAFLQWLGAIGWAQSSPLLQAHLDVIFIVDDATQETTVYYSIGYTNAPPNTAIRWLMTVPEGAVSVELDDWAITPILQLITEPDIDAYLEDVCELTVRQIIADGALPSPDYIGPQKATIQRFASAVQAQEWLAESPLTLAPTQPLKADSVFVGVEMQTAQDIPEADGYWISAYIHRSPLLKVVYPFEMLATAVYTHSLALATHLDNYDADGFIPVTIYVYANQPYQIDNYPSLDIDLTSIVSEQNILDNALLLPFGVTAYYNIFDPDYYELIHQSLRIERGFVVEHRQSPPLTPYLYSRPESIYTEPANKLNTLSQTYAYLTRFRTFVHVGEAWPDIQLKADPAAPPFFMSLREVTDEAWFWGCTSRRQYDPTLDQRLPAGRTDLRNFRTQVAHPPDWTMSVLSDDLVVFAPQEVTLETLEEMERGIGRFPMFVLQKLRQPFVEKQYDGYMPLDIKSHPILISGTERPPTARLQDVNYWPQPTDIDPSDPSAYAEGIKLVFYASSDDWSLNQSLYVDMFQYAASYSYYLSPLLRYTLFVGDLGSHLSGRSSDLIAIGYPADWVEFRADDRQRIIAPSRTHWEEGAYVRIWEEEPIGTLSTPEMPVVFTARGRKGYLFASANYQFPYIEISAPEEDYDAYEQILTEIAKTIIIARP